MGAKKKIYTPGEEIGEMVFIEETEPKTYTYMQISRMARFRCTCGEEIVTNIQSVRSGGTRSCGCAAGGKWNGLSKHPLFRHWGAMMTRCYNENHSDYKWYGGRGISVYPGWIKDPQAYIDHISSLDDFGKEKYTIDRENNDGNYEPGNIRWASQSMQMQNTSRGKSKTGYVGVYFSKKKSRYRGTVYNNGERIPLGYNFHTAKDAAIARDQYIIDNNLDQLLQVLQITV